MALGCPGPLGFPVHVLEENPPCVDCCGSQQEKRGCLRGITIPLLNWKLNKPQPGLKGPGKLGTSGTQMNCGQPQGMNFTAPTGAAFLPFFIDIAGNSNIRDPWILQ